MKQINVETISKEELNKLPYSSNEVVGKEFNQVIIIPTDDIHDSGFRCMKYVLLYWELGYDNEIVGVVGGYSDVIRIKNDYTRIDCLPCGYLRVLLEERATVPGFIGSDFFVEDWSKYHV